MAGRNSAPSMPGLDEEANRNPPLCFFSGHSKRPRCGPGLQCCVWGLKIVPSAEATPDQRVLEVLFCQEHIDLFNRQDKLQAGDDEDSAERKPCELVQMGLLHPGTQAAEEDRIKTLFNDDMCFENIHFNRIAETIFLRSRTNLWPHVLALMGPQVKELQLHKYGFHVVNAAIVMCFDREEVGEMRRQLLESCHLRKALNSGEARGSLEHIIKFGTTKEWKVIVGVVVSDLEAVMNDKHAVHRLVNLILRWRMKKDPTHLELVQKVLQDFPSELQDYRDLAKADAKKAEEAYPAFAAAIETNEKLNYKIKLARRQRQPAAATAPARAHAPQPAFAIEDTEMFPDLGAGKPTRNTKAGAAAGAQLAPPMRAGQAAGAQLEPPVNIGEGKKATRATLPDTAGSAQRALPEQTAAEASRTVADGALDRGTEVWPSASSSSAPADGGPQPDAAAMPSKASSSGQSKKSKKTKYVAFHH